MLRTCVAAGWEKVVKGVHQKDGKIFLQLWHMGRQSHSSFNPAGEIVSASPIAVGFGQTKNTKGENVRMLSMAHGLFIV